MYRGVYARRASCNPFVYLINFIAYAIIAVKCYFAFYQPPTKPLVLLPGQRQHDHDH